MKVQNMKGRTGKPVANQFIISGVYIEYTLRTREMIRPPIGDMFQSYNSNIVFMSHNGSVFLDETYWNYSSTTGKYRNLFLGETKKETQAKINSGEYKLVNLNGE